uniref:Uncharacterized protein n=1 Tax=Plectus sambesii TaxID=2011161 RepID=A0A914WUM2_9BILA
MARKSFGELEKWCTKVETRQEENLKPSITLQNGGFLRDLQRHTVLIITGNYAFGPSISLLQRLHEPFFATVIFCGSIYPEKIYPFREVTGFPPVTQFSYINVTEEEMQAGYRAYMCTSKAIEMNIQNVTGYVVMSDDTVFNFWNELDLSRFRLNQVGRQIDLPWWSYDVGLPAMNRAVQILRARIESEPNSELATAWTTYSTAVGGDGYALLNERDVWGLSDWYFLPTANATVFYQLAEVFFEAQLFHEIVVPKIGAALQWLDFYKTTNKTDIGNCLHIWTKARNVWEQHYNKDLIYFHPVKLSFIGYTASDRLNYCQHIVRTFRDAIANVSITET